VEYCILHFAILSARKYISITRKNRTGKGSSVRPRFTSVAARYFFFYRSLHTPSTYAHMSIR